MDKMKYGDGSLRCMTQQFRNGLCDGRETTVNERVYRLPKLFENLSRRVQFIYLSIYFI